jgi:hypothetical protein
MKLSRNSCTKTKRKQEKTRGKEEKLNSLIIYSRSNNGTIRKNTGDINSNK